MTSRNDTSQAADGNAPPAALPFAGRTKLQVMRSRADFLRAARGRKVVTPGFILQIRDRRDADPAVRVGFTCSKKVGNAVARNRAKRRLREIARAVLPALGAPGHDYVLIGRAGETASRPLPRMIDDLANALGPGNGGPGNGGNRA